MKRRCRDRQSPERYRVASTVRERINPIARSGINRRSLEVAPSEALLGRERGRKVGGHVDGATYRQEKPLATATFTQFR